MGRIAFHISGLVMSCMSLLNHSCDPNCSIVFNGPHLLLRAVRDIEVGEELTICYLDMLMTSEERRKQLRDQYCFECDCFRCQTQDKEMTLIGAGAVGELPQFLYVLCISKAKTKLQTPKERAMIV
ncbi:SET and MYND domain-containing protein 3 [Tupaia chinensis]|uniref:SET and MYND domain-containing protein 3 n=1 Tax=Tupaia chinensis TaxID=246437 RepID=L9JGQ4_TUPCH|nr:SET and MYND domain-containing protein 3 [Tupaia chinensis]